MVFINGKSTSNETSAENGSVESNQFPHCGVVVGKDLELCVEVEVEEDETGKGSSCVTGWHGLQTVVDFVHITRADALVKHDLTVSIGDVAVAAAGLNTVVGSTNAGTKVFRNNGLADGEEVRAETTNEPFDKDLEDCGGNERV